MYGLYSNHHASPPRRRIVSEADLDQAASRHHSILDREDQELLLRDWQLERRQLQMENQRLTKLLDNAHKHIRILKNNQSFDDGLVSVSSNAATVKAGCSSARHDIMILAESTVSSRSSSPCKRRQTRKLLPKLFHRHEVHNKEEHGNDMSPMTTVEHDITSCDAVCDVRDDRDTIITGAPMLRARTLSKSLNLSKSLKQLLAKPNESFDSATEASSSFGAPPSKAEF